MRAFLVVLTAAVAALLLAPSSVTAAGPASAEEPNESAVKACLDGRWLLVQNRLDEAIARFDLALTLSPKYDEATQLMAQAKARRAEAQQHYDQAAALAKQTQWDEAIQQVQAALGVFPAYVEAKTLGTDIRRQAGDSFMASGVALLAAGNPEAAETSFRRVLDYLPDAAAPREALARVDFSRGQAAAVKGLWGAALVWLTESVSFAPKNPLYQDQLKAARVAVASRIQISLALDRPAMVSADTSELRTAAWKRLAAVKPDFVTLAAAPEAGPAAFTIGLDVTSLTVKEGPIRIENRAFPYKAAAEEANPDYDRLVAQIENEQTYLARLIQDNNNFICSHCGGDGIALCRLCWGSGWRTSPRPTRGGSTGTPCPACGGTGEQVCLYCGGAGHGTPELRRLIAQAQRDMTAMLAVLARTPAKRVKQVEAQWPYTIEHHDKTGTVEAGLRVTGPGVQPAADAVRKTKRFEDTAIPNPKPEIGLRADLLTLPADEDVRRAAIDEAAVEAAGKILAVVLGARAAELQAASQKLLAEGKLASAVEAGADAALLKETLSPAQAGRLMQVLRDRMRIEERFAPPPAVPPPPRI
jgi:tetratricopeptide (TPR) repeat protein